MSTFEHNSLLITDATISAEDIEKARRVLIANGASDLLEMVGVA